jgi:Uma2 family endonuclease
MVKIPPQPTPLKIPPLENGAPKGISYAARLTRPEFERRYNAMPHLKKAELIEGVVYVAAPALRFRSHGQPHGNIIGWLWTYAIATNGVELGDNPTVRLDLNNAPQPDAVLLIDPDCDGQVRLSEDDYVEGAPELIAEVAASTTSIDLGDKKRAYRRNGVKEYIVWQVFDQKLDWFSLQEGEYVSLPVDSDGVIRSQVFPGLWLAVNDLLTGNMTQVMAVIQAGLNSPGHQAFLQRVQARPKGS